MEFHENTIGEEVNGKPPDEFLPYKKLRALSLVSATLEIEYAMEFYGHNIGEEGNGEPLHKIHFPRKNSEPCLWYLLRSK